MNYWLWIIPNDVTGLWDFCQRASVAAMEYQIGANKKAKLHHNLAAQIAINDKVVAYLNNNRIGGVGTVTKEFFEDTQGYKSQDGLPYAQRIGVEWVTVDPSIDVRKLPGIDFNSPAPKLSTQTIHPIKQNECELIEKAIRIANQNPLLEMATLLEEVSLEDERCRTFKLWQQSVEPITRPFLEYIGTLIQQGIRLRQNKVVTLSFKSPPRDIKKQANTRDSLCFETSKQRYQLWVYCGREIEGYADKFIWGLFWWGKNARESEVRNYLDTIRTGKETLFCTEDKIFAGTYCTLLNYITAAELRRADPIDLARHVFEDLMSLYQRIENNAYLPNMKELEGNMTGLMNFIQAQGFHFPASLVTTYYLSLQTKPFVILTGISGTGKTKLAQLFAEWMSPTIEIQSEVKEEPLDDAESFYMEVRPSYLKSGLVIPKRAYGYFDLAEPGHTKDVKIQLGNTGQVVSSAMRNQVHTSGGSYVYFFYKKPLREWLNANFEPGDILKFQVIKENTEYRLSKFAPTVRRIIERTPRLAFISVHPDWTDNRGLVGFYNLITGAYQTTDFLRLLLQATVDSASPHFVILDEMNLAKVEHYFADFLSVLESRYLQDGQLKQEPLRLHDLPRCVVAQGESPWGETPDEEVGEQAMCQVRCAGCPLRAGVTEAQQVRGESTYEDAYKSGFDPLHYVPPRLFVPRNVYFSGTVNVDETTYMFSPKVLDRANTIEFNAVDLAQYFAEPAASAAPDAEADETTRATFTFEGEFVRLPKSVLLRTEPVLAPYREQLMDLNQRLEAHTLHFGYRVADEILLYLWNAWELNAPDFTLDAAFDYQICQKILPKFHGSQARLQEPLCALLEFCSQHQYDHSAVKINRMLEALNKEGFASFA